MLWQQIAAWFCLSTILKQELWIQIWLPFTSKSSHDVKHGFHFQMVLKFCYKFGYECHMNYLHAEGDPVVSIKYRSMSIND